MMANRIPQIVFFIVLWGLGVRWWVLGGGCFEKFAAKVLKVVRICNIYRKKSTLIVIGHYGEDGQKVVSLHAVFGKREKKRLVDVGV